VQARNGQVQSGNEYLHDRNFYYGAEIIICGKEISIYRAEISICRQEINIYREEISICRKEIASYGNEIVNCLAAKIELQSRQLLTHFFFTNSAYSLLIE